MKFRKPAPELKIDPSSTGISFVDILFALVITEILNPVQHWISSAHGSLPSVEIMNLLLVLTISLTSWIGYHSSVNRPQFQIDFFNLELAKFLLDIIMVVLYFLMASVAVRGTHGLKILALFTFLSFLAYDIWDHVSKAQKGKEKYSIAFMDSKETLPPTVTWSTKYHAGRHAATIICLILTAVIWALTEWLTPTKGAPSVTWAIATDSALMGVLIFFRFLKHALNDIGVRDLRPDADPDAPTALKATDSAPDQRGQA